MEAEGNLMLLTGSLILLGMWVVVALSLIPLLYHMLHDGTTGEENTQRISGIWGHLALSITLLLVTVVACGIV
jgi:hypothetical protein